jgi:uracil-DNA glycosylase family 4
MKTKADAVARVRQWRALGLDTLWIRPERLALISAEQPDSAAIRTATVEPTHRPLRSKGTVLPSQAPHPMPVSHLPKLPDLVWPILDAAHIQATLHECRRCDLFDETHRPWFGLAASQPKCFLLMDAPKPNDTAKEALLETVADRLPMDEDHQALLSNMLAAIHLRIGVDVFVTSLIKCQQYGVIQMASPARQVARQACASYWQAQIAWLKPQVIIALGQESAQTLAQVSEAGCYQSIPVIELPHPAYLLRHLDDKATVWPALLRLAAVLKTH